MTKPSLLRLLCLLQVFCLLFPFTATAAGIAPESDSSLIHILLVGRDEDCDTVSRSDSIILCSFQPDTKRVTITSFLRDLYVPIPGHQSNRINAAYACGGLDLLRKTIETNFDLTIDGCIDVDFSQFSQIIDILGGVTLELRQDEAEAVNRRVEGSLTEGTHTLTGEQALAYSRIRNLDADGDFSRTGRQRKLLTSLLDGYRNANLLTLLSMLTQVLPIISTDLETRQIIALAAKLYPFLKDPIVVSQRLPADGTYTFQQIRGMEVLTADMTILRQTLYSTLHPENENVS